MYIQTILLAIILIITLTLLILLYKLIGKKSNASDPLNETALASLLIQISSLEKRMKEELSTNRQEASATSAGLRTEMADHLFKFSQLLSEQHHQLIRTNQERLESLSKSIEDRLNVFQQNIDLLNKSNRQAQQEQQDRFKTELQEALQDYKNRLREQFSSFETIQQTHQKMQNDRLIELRQTLEQSVKTMQEGNEKKLEEMRQTVDEKLNQTLEKRLGESFKQVSDRLEAVHKGLGEMQTLAVSVGDLKKVMSNVKSRGILGEYQLQNIIEDLLTNDQYERNVKTKSDSGAIVEFAIKMPHGKNLEKTIWLPIDSKFPREDYEALTEAYETGDATLIETHRKAFAQAIKKSAREIREKYVDPPNTTEYAILFLPYESLFGEVLRIPGLFDQLQRDYKITVTGPTTLSALLNSLQMGFRTLAIEKRSSEVWDLLGAVKTEFGQFGDILAKTKKKLIEATNVIDSSEVRTRAIERKLRHVQELPAAAADALLNPDNSVDG